MRDAKWTIAFRSRLVWAGSIIGALLAIGVFLIINSFDSRVESIETTLPCFGVSAEEEPPKRCRDITTDRINAMTPAQACRIVNKAQSKLVVSINGKAEQLVIQCQKVQEMK